MNKLYKQHIENPTEFTKSLWGYIPKNLSEIGQILLKSSVEWGENYKNINDSLKEIIKKTHKQYGVYTQSIKSLLNKWDDKSQVIEIGHQPLYFGGGSFIINKISFTIGLSQFLNQEMNCNTIPILFLGDHDQVQNELIISRLPQAAG